MGTPDKFVFEYKEIVELLIKKEDIHEGLWTINLDLSLKGANMGPSDEQLVPVAMIAILRIGIQRVEEKTNLTVDSSEVNPLTKSTPGKKKIK